MHIIAHFFRNTENNTKVKALKRFSKGDLPEFLIGYVSVEDGNGIELFEKSHDRWEYSQLLILFTHFLSLRTILAGIAAFLNHSCSPNCRFIRKRHSRVEVQVSVDSEQKLYSSHLSLRLSERLNLGRSSPLNMQILFVIVLPALLLGINMTLNSRTNLS